MSKIFIEEATLTGIGDAIREVEGSTELIPPLEMPERIKALGGAGVEYTTGTATFARSYSAQTIAHGLSKSPKLFFLYWENYTTTTTVYKSFVVYTEKVASSYSGSTTVITLNENYTSVPGIYAPNYSDISADETNVYITGTARQWESGTWRWEAYTW